MADIAPILDENGSAAVAGSSSSSHGHGKKQKSGIAGTGKILKNSKTDSAFRMVSTSNTNTNTINVGKVFDLSPLLPLLSDK